MTDSLFDRTKKPVLDCLKEAGVSASEIDELVLVGGMTRMPKVVEIAGELAGKDPSPGRESGRGGRHRRLHPGRRAPGRRERRAPARRDPAVTLDRDQGAIATPMIERNTTIPAKKVPELFHRCGQPARGRHPHLPGRA